MNALRTTPHHPHDSSIELDSIDLPSSQTFDLTEPYIQLRASVRIKLIKEVDEYYSLFLPRRRGRWYPVIISRPWRLPETSGSDVTISEHTSDTKDIRYIYWKRCGIHFKDDEKKVYWLDTWGRGTPPSYDLIRDGGITYDGYKNFIRLFQSINSLFAAYKGIRDVFLAHAAACDELARIGENIRASSTDFNMGISAPTQENLGISNNIRRKLRCAMFGESTESDPCHDSE
jgi:hypothetical protein